MRREVKAPKRRRVWRILGRIGICVGIFLLATILALVSSKDSFDNLLSQYERYVVVLSQEVDIDVLTPAPIAVGDYTAYVQKWSEVGINFSSSGEIVSEEDVEFADSVTVSSNEFGAYANKRMLTGEGSLFEILQVDITERDSSYILKSVYVINLGQLDSGIAEVAGVPNSLYITTTSVVARVGNQIFVANTDESRSKNHINQIENDINEEIFTALFGSKYSIVDSMVNGILIEEINNLTKLLDCSVRLSENSITFSRG